MEIKPSKTDYIVSITKGIIGAAPTVGPLIAEIVGNIIPNQRIERLTDFVTMLEEKISGMDKTFIEGKLKEPEFIDLLEDSFLPAAKALSLERRKQITSVVSNSLADKEIKAFQAKMLLRILSELNDDEVIHLQFYAKLTSPDRNEYFNKHKDILRGPVTHTGSTDEERDQEALHSTYKTHLEQLKLIKPEFRSPMKGELPEFDK